MSRSKNEAFMEGLKKSVLAVTKGLEKEDRKFALDYLRTHVKIDDLHQQALRNFPGKVIDFGEGSMNPLIVVVTKDRITDEQKQKLVLAWRKLGVPEDEVYYAHLRFVKTKKKQDVRQQILEHLVHILDPELVVTLDAIKLSAMMKPKVMATGVPAQALVDEAAKHDRRTLTKSLKTFTKSLVG